MTDMKNDFLIFIVEDDLTMQLLLESELEDAYGVELFSSAESCLSRLSEKKPDLFLTDVGLPGISGYELSRKIKDAPETADIPVMFISSYDKLEDALAGYDAGGEDYIVKPFDTVLLVRKIENLRRTVLGRQSILEQAKSSDQLASLVLSNLDEYAILVKFLRSLNDCATPRALINSLFGLLEAYRLKAAIQIRLPGLEMTVSADGEERPLEVSVINHVRNLDRIFEFKARAVYNFEHITILINNVPVDDPELCGRLRDHLAIAAEAANVKIDSLQTKADFSQAKETVTELLGELKATVTTLDRQYSGARFRGGVVTQEMLNELAKAFASLGLSDEQEIGIDSIVRDKTSELVGVFDFSDVTQQTIQDIAKRLESVLSPSSIIEASQPGALNMGGPDENETIKVELF
ncbi:MAG: hypothetical protein RIR18_50 [Pseudomonadota bacterium]